MEKCTTIGVVKSHSAASAVGGAYAKPDSSGGRGPEKNPPPLLEAKRERPLCDFWAIQGAFT